MPRASPNGALILTMAGMAVVLCGALVVTMEYAKTEIKVRRGEARAKTPAGPENPFATQIKNLTHREFAVTQLGEDDREFAGRHIRTSEPGLYLDVVSGVP